MILAAASSVRNYRDNGADPAERCVARLAAIGEKAVCEAPRRPHRRPSAPVPARRRSTWAAPRRRDLPTDERLKHVARGDDPQLAALYFQYGRYLLIASSRPGCQPANLQGIWNDQMKPSWDSKWTVNINTEMNYWPAEVTNLAECHEPLFDLIDDVAETGRKTAEAHYGARGWVLHHNTDLWRGTAPINKSNHGIWPTGGAWLCHHLWEHYQFTGDRYFLGRRAYPRMKDAALFFVDVLVKDPRTGWLISTPSNSPEQGGLVAGPTMDHQLIRDLFANTAQAAAILGVDRALADQLERPARPDRPQPGRQVRPAPGMARGQGRPQEPAPPRLAPLGPAPRLRDHPPRHPCPGRRGAAVARLPRRRRHRLEQGLEDQLLGPVPRRRPRPQDAHRGPGGEHPAQPLRHPPPVPDRRQLRRHRRHRRDAAAKPHRRDRAPARAAPERGPVARSRA